MNAMDQANGTAIGYAIRIKGTLGETVLGAFPGLEPMFRDGDTVLVGQLADQPALHGVLAQIEALGLELVEVWRLTDSTIHAPLAAQAAHAP
jgi:hypothetical protein